MQRSLLLSKVELDKEGIFVRTPSTDLVAVTGLPFGLPFDLYRDVQLTCLDRCS